MGSLIGDRAGASTVEQVIVIALVALGALGAFAALGDGVEEQVTCAAGAIGGAGSPCAPAASSVAGGVPHAARPIDHDGARARDARGGPRDGAGDRSAEAGAATGALSDEMAGYQRDLDDAVRAIEADFEAFSGGDDRITTSDLERDRSSDDPDVSAAAATLLDDPAASNALDVGSGRGEVDGEISRADVAGFAWTMQEGDLVEALADTASGRGGRDHRVSRDDLLALASNEHVPDDIRLSAHARASTMPEDDGCGNVFCSAWNGLTDAADWAWDATDDLRDGAGDAMSWAAGLGQRMMWMQGIPLALPSQWDDFLTFRASFGLGAIDWVVQTGRGLFEMGEWLVDREVSAWRALSEGDALTFLATETHLDLVDDIPRVWDAANATVRGLGHQIDTLAVGEPDEAGRAGGSLAMDAASIVVPSAILAKGARGAAVIAVPSEAAEVAADVRLIEVAGATPTSYLSGELALARDGVSAAPRFFERVAPRSNLLTSAPPPLEARLPIASALEQLPDDITRTLLDGNWTITYAQTDGTASLAVRTSRTVREGMSGELQMLVGPHGELPPLSGPTFEQFMRTSIERGARERTTSRYLSVDRATRQDAAYAARAGEDAPD